MVYLPHWPIPNTLGKAQIDYESVFERISLILEKLGNPHKKLPPVIHVAGTNGKGSSAVFLAKIFSCAGYKAHLYTSPHLHDCNERIILNGEKISDSELFQTMEEVRKVTENFTPEIPLSFAEGFTIGALLSFSKNPADVVIIECGMGGRIDSTNIIEEKLATVITPISFDHMEYLGDSIQKISLEKAMIMRPNTPVIVASQAKEAQEIIDILAQDQKAPSYYFDEDFSVMMDEETGTFSFEMFGKNKHFYFEDLPKPALPGQHQYINFTTTIAAICVISEQKPDLFQIDEKHIKKAIENVDWPNRLEKVEGNLNKILNNPNSEIWIDGAHNVSGAFSVARWLEDKKKEDANKKITKKTFLIAGFTKGKCKKEFLEQFKDVTQEIVAVRVQGEPNPENPQIISEIAKSIGMKSSFNDESETYDLLDALYYIGKSTNYESSRVIICGSLHLARDVKKFSS